VTLNEAYRFAYDETLRRTERTQAGAQHANYEFRLAGSGDLILTDVSNTSAMLQLDRTLSGRLYLRDSAGRLVVEVNKLPKRILALGLEPGRYFITLSQPARLLGGEVTVENSATTLLRESDLRKLERERVTLRGDTQSDESVEVYYGLEGEDYERRTFCFNFIPGISNCPSTGGEKKLVKELQLSVLLGISDIIEGWDIALLGSVVQGRIDGAQTTGLLAINQGRTDGIQLAMMYAMTMGDADAWQHGGALGVTLGELNGAQTAGAAGYIGGDAQGAQIVGGAAITRGRMDGVQIAGIGTIAGGGIDGAQVNGVFAVSADKVDGAQVSGVASISSGPIDGAQVSGLLNVSSDSTDGAQIGVVNVTWGPVNGTQIGVINIAERYESGAPIGLLNFVGNGRLHLDVWASDVFASNVGMRFGSDHVYTLISVGTQPSLGEERARSGLTLGVGTRFAVLNSGWGALDVLATGLAFGDSDESLPTDVFRNDERLYQLRVMLGTGLVGPLDVFGGISANVFHSSEGRERSGLAWSSGTTFGGDDNFLRLWPGIFAGVQF
ncbi:MAG: hypothetical protein AAFQ82_03980, partial [Myxococcota bacterium]